MNEENIGTVTESAAEAESFNDEDFISGLFEGENFAEEDEDPFAEIEDEDPFGEEPEETAKPKTETEESAASEPNPEEEPDEELSFVEHGKTFKVSKKAAESLATALGLTPEKLIEVYQKGCGFDAQKARLEAAQKDTEMLNKLAGIRNVKPEELRNDILSQLEKIPYDNALEQIKRENPELPEKIAEELAKYRVAAEKPKAEPTKEPVEENEETSARLREVEMFEANHPELGKLPNEVVAKWEKSGISLEEAYENFRIKTEKAELEKELAEMKKEKAEAEQKKYAKEHSPGSGKTGAGVVLDEFAAGLFAEY